MAKNQSGPSYTFLTMPFFIFSPVYLLLRHPLGYVQLFDACLSKVKDLDNHTYKVHGIQTEKETLLKHYHAVHEGRKTYKKSH